MTSDKVYIYTLCDPDTGEIRYVGKTVDLKTRYGHHKHKILKTHTSCWIRSLTNSGKMFVMRVVEECDKDTWAEAEKWWIKQLREWGHDLTNISKGGRGNPGFEVSEENRLKVSQFHKGRKRSAITKQRLSASAKGRKFSQLARERQKLAMEKHIPKYKGKKMPPEYSRVYQLALRKLKDEEVLQIRKFVKEEVLSYADIAKKFNVCSTTISNIVRNKMYAEIREDQDEIICLVKRRDITKVNLETYNTILAMFQKGLSRNKISKALNLSVTVVEKIAKGSFSYPNCK